MKRMMSGMAAVAIMAAVAGQSRADVKVGDKMPELKVAQLHNNEYNVELNDLQGYVVVVEFWATWCGPCKASIPHLNELHEKFKDRGVVFIGISDEDDGLVAPFINEMKMKYIVASGGDETQQAFGVQGIPHAVLFDPTLTARWIGNPHPQADGAELEKQIQTMLGSTPPSRLLGSGPDYNEKLLASIETALIKGDTPGALSQLRRVDRKSLDAREGHKARYDAIVNRITPMAQADFDRAQGAARAKQYTDALAMFKRVAAEYKGLPIADKAAAELKRLEADPEVLKAKQDEAVEARAGNMLNRAKAQIEDGEDVVAYKRLKVLVEKFPHTIAASEAEKLIKAFEADPEFMKKVNGG